MIEFPIMAPVDVIAADAESVCERIAPIWRQLDGAEVFITGGTGFVGTWLLATLLAARRCLGVRVASTVLSRDPGRFLRRHPWADVPSIRWMNGDVRNLIPEPAVRPTHIIHGATDTDARRNQQVPGIAFDTPVQGTARVIDAARRWNCTRLLVLSSGAIYGVQPPGLELMDEGYHGGPDTLDPAYAYHEGKRGAEMLAAIAQGEGGLEIPIARLFAFVGPCLPLDAHFAVGNFIGDGLAARDLVVRGDGRTVRSYLYAADLTGWLWTMLAKGQGGRAYNVGSDQVIDMAGLARACASCFHPTPLIRILGRHDPVALPSRYVPAIRRASDELGLAVWTDLSTALRRTIQHHRQVGG